MTGKEKMSQGMSKAARSSVKSVPHLMKRDASVIFNGFVLTEKYAGITKYNSIQLRRLN